MPETKPVRLAVLLSGGGRSLRNMIENIDAGELPAEVRRRWISELGLSPQAVMTLTQHPAYVRLFEQTRRELDQSVKIANWLGTEVLRDVRVH
jgi:aspartyl-tRNA(Asn)/glutamyl-tRNA(Gln) amidotransferase subunit B